MFTTAFRRQSHIFWGFGARLGQEMMPEEIAPEPIPEPEPIAPLEPEPVPMAEPEPPAPEPVCKAFGAPVRENGTCKQIFQCKHADGTISYKAEPATCPPERIVVRRYYPIAVPVGVYASGGPAGEPLEIRIPKEKSTLETVAPYGIGLAVVGGILYATGVFG